MLNSRVSSACFDKTPISPVTANFIALRDFRCEDELTDKVVSSFEEGWLNSDFSKNFRAAKFQEAPGCSISGSGACLDIILINPVTANFIVVLDDIINLSLKDVIVSYEKTYKM